MLYLVNAHKYLILSFDTLIPKGSADILAVYVHIYKHKCTHANPTRMCMYVNVYVYAIHM